MSKIIGFCGQKTSGKSTIANIFTLVALQRYSLGSNLQIDGKSGKVMFEGEAVHPNRLNSSIVKQYAIADCLKELCVDILGLEPEGVYGSEDDKSKLSNYYWENMPGVITNKRAYVSIEKMFRENNWRESSWPWLFHKKGQMTNREVMQFVGTDIFRKMDSQVWVNCILKRIKEDNPEYALITDVRFDNEIFTFSKMGTVIGLTKKPPYQDTHTSEKINLQYCKHVIKNENAKNVKDLIECIYTTFGKNKDLLSL